MKKILLTVLLLLLNTVYIAAQSGEGWTKTSTNYYLESLNEDNEGNLYACGAFSSPSMTIDNISLTTDENTRAVFITKIDAQGNAIWAKKIATSPDWANGHLKPDGNGNFYIYGNFSTQLNFENITFTAPLYSSQMYLAKLDNEGNLIWAKKAGGNCCSLYTRKIIITSDNNIILSGIFDAPSINFGSNVVNQIGGNDEFIVKFDSNGNDIWAITQKGEAADMDDAHLAATNDGSFYVTGSFKSSTYKIGNIILTNNGESDIYFAKYDALGNILWAKSIGGSNFDHAEAITVDSGGNVLLVGSYINSFTIDNHNLTAIGHGDMFIGKFTPNGDAIWIKTVGAPELAESGTNVSTDSNNNIYLAGSFSSPSLTIGDTTLNNSGVFTSFLTKLNNVGDFGDTIGIYSSGLVTGSIEFYPSGNIFASGSFMSDVTINDETFNINEGGYGNFYAKLNSAILGVKPVYSPENISIYPNPAKNTLNIAGDIDSNQSFIIVDMTGRIIKQGDMTDKSIEISYLPKGLYIFKMGNGINTKFIKE